MARSKFSQLQISAILDEHEAGRSVKELCRRHHITDTTFYNWRRRYRSAFGVAASALEPAEKENVQLREQIADLLAEVSQLRDIIAKHVP